MDITSHTAPVSDGDRAPRKTACSSVSGLTIAGIVLGFIVFWPIGLAMLAWAIWRREIAALPIVKKARTMRAPKAPNFQGLMATKPSNSALAAYLDREQKRLHEEQKKLDDLVKAFEAFKDAERAATDQRDFEEFLRRHDASDVVQSDPAPNKPAA